MVFARVNTTLSIRTLRSTNVLSQKNRDLDSERIWTVPRSSSPKFVGRSDILDDLLCALNPEVLPTPPRQRRFFISGLGGIGKSEVSIKFAEQHQDKYVQNRVLSLFPTNLPDSGVSSGSMLNLVHR